LLANKRKKLLKVSEYHIAFLNSLEFTVMGFSGGSGSYLSFISFCSAFIVVRKFVNWKTPYVLFIVFEVLELLHRDAKLAGFFTSLHWHVSSTNHRATFGQASQETLGWLHKYSTNF
jgi:hypothetical protein